jgi:hypothetical protein
VDVHFDGGQVHELIERGHRVHHFRVRRVHGVSSGWLCIRPGSRGTAP